MINAQQMADRYMASMKSGETQNRYKQGIDSVTESPMAKAASDEATQLYLRRVQESVTSGKRQAKLMAVPLQRYKDNAKAKADRLASGAETSRAKIVAHFQRFQSIYQQASDAAKALPKGGINEAQARWRASTEVLMAAAGRT